MKIKYNANIENNAIVVRLTHLTNQIYALLPNREEGNDWVKPLETIVEELAGMDRLLLGQHETLTPLLSKLEGLFTLDRDEYFHLYRRTIFECLSLVGELIKSCQKI